MSEKKEMSAREQAIIAIREGGSVIIPVEGQPFGKQFSSANLSELPSEAEFAMFLGNSDEQKDAEAKIEAQIEALTQAKAKLRTMNFSSSKEESSVEEKKAEPKAEEKKVSKDNK